MHTREQVINMHWISAQGFSQYMNFQLRCTLSCSNLSWDSCSWPCSHTSHAGHRKCSRSVHSDHSPCPHSDHWHSGRNDCAPCPGSSPCNYPGSCHGNHHDSCHGNCPDSCLCSSHRHGNFPHVDTNPGIWYQNTQKWISTSLETHGKDWNTK